VFHIVDHNKIVGETRIVVCTGTHLSEFGGQRKKPAEAGLE
jgi:hypothetical protein